MNTTIGSVSPGARNVISGNAGSSGILVRQPQNAVIQGNYIGTDSSGTTALGNDTGIEVFEGSTLIGGEVSGAANVISGNSSSGILLETLSAEITDQRNFIGTQADGVSPMGNGGHGAILQGSVGGHVAFGDTNVTAFNGGDGVRVRGDLIATIRANSIHSNGGKGIDNVESGEFTTPPPVITSAGSAAGTACAGCTVDVYSDSEDEGRVYHGATTADSSGNWSFGGAVVGPNVTATATDANGTTSEFSAPFACLDEDGDGVCNSGDPTPLDVCAGRAVTIRGSDGPDSLVGTAVADVIDGAGGDDFIRGRGGDDVICGGSGSDLIEGEAGDDAAFGEAGNDRLEGGKEADLLDGGIGSDRCFGGEGRDAAVNCEKRSSIP